MDWHDLRVIWSVAKCQIVDGETHMIKGELREGVQD